MRKLVTIQKIAEVSPIEGADAIVKVRVNDWWCIAKLDEFQVGDLCCYHEIDSLLPIGGVYDFLAPRGTSKSELEDGTIVEGYRLKSIRLRKQLSQGLVLSAYILGQHAGLLEVGTDVTEELGVHKYEKPMSQSLRGAARGNFPSFLRKSEQERCQNLRTEIWLAYIRKDKFQVTYKLDGSSMTVFNIVGDTAEHFGTEPRFGVCSRNLELKDTEGNAFWHMAHCRELQKTIDIGSSLMLQGELVSPTIQGNFENVSSPEFYVYNMFDITNQVWVSPSMTSGICGLFGIKHVPVMYDNITLPELFPDATSDTIVQLLLDFAEGESGLGGAYREGVVFKCLDNDFSFKAISNKYLLKSKD